MPTLAQIAAWLTPKPKRKAWKRDPDDAERIYGTLEFREWLHRQPCIICGSRVGIQQCHAKGDGVSRKASWQFSFPACVRCHGEQHRIGNKTFEERRGVVLLDLAAQTLGAWVLVKEGE